MVCSSGQLGLYEQGIKDVAAFPDIRVFASFFPLRMRGGGVVDSVDVGIMAGTSDNIDVRQRALDEVRRIVLDELQGVPTDVYLFGSRALGCAGPASDVDVGVMPRDGLPPGLLSRIRERLEQSTIPYSVDLVDLSQTEEAFRERVRREGILWTD